MQIFKILHAPEWATLCDQGATAGSALDRADGYVHFSTAEQVRETCAKHFAGADDLVLLAVDTDTLGDALKWEPARQGALFPHLYRELRLEDLLWQTDLPLGPEGHEFPDLDG